MVRIAKGIEEIAVVLRRKALIEIATTYNEVTEHIRTAKGPEKGGLGHGRMASAKARKISYATLYPGMADQKRMGSLIDYDMRCASPYVSLRVHYDHDGISATIPPKTNEMELQNPARFPAPGEFLDF